MSHRTQEERRAETRAKVLDATIKSVMDDGYAATTTRHVSELAGVSAGAMAHYFPRRVDLVSAAAQRLAEQRILAGRQLAGTLPDDAEDRIGTLLDLLWEDFATPTFGVFLKLWIAAADDPELYEALAVSEREIARMVTELAIDSIGDLTDQPGWEGRLLVALSALRGLALYEHFEPRTAARPDPWPSARAALLDTLTP